MIFTSKQQKMQNSLATIQAIAQQERMRPAHAMLEKAATKRLVKRAKALLEGASDNDATQSTTILRQRRSLKPVWCGELVCNKRRNAHFGCVHHRRDADTL